MKAEAETYSHDCCKLYKEENKYKDLQEGFRKVVANQLQCDLELITPITLDEYLNNTEGEE